MLKTAIRLLSSDSREKREAAELFLRFAPYEIPDDRFSDAEELRRMDFRLVAMALTGSESFPALAACLRADDAPCGVMRR